ncbi:MAG TPA: ribosomal protein S18-alanine N-acetyltransferase [Thermoanaerobaculia bacterium]|nr:ribosomal protein S18-alanine N-acetyltransferase [Thermoanaerobaculia bacterium]
MSANLQQLIDIRTALLADIDEIDDLEQRCFTNPWRRDFFESELRGSGRYSLVARKDGRIAGYVFAMWFFDEMHINKIAVDERERRQGIALALMGECLRFAKTNRIKTISLEVRKTNQGAQDFYRVLDFEPSYTRPRYYPDGEAAVIMVRTLS